MFPSVFTAVSVVYPLSIHTLQWWHSVNYFHLSNQRVALKSETGSVMPLLKTLQWLLASFSMKAESSQCAPLWARVASDLLLFEGSVHTPPPVLLIHHSGLHFKAVSSVWIALSLDGQNILHSCKSRLFLQEKKEKELSEGSSQGAPGFLFHALPPSL